MKGIKTYILAMLLLCAATTASADKARILEQKQGSITFVVDENLPKPKNEYFNWISQADRLKSLGAASYYGLDNSYIAASFWDQPLMVADAPFFTGMVQAFADHRPITLSPDVIWMLISQAFSHDVNADPEKFRDKFVDFDGKIDLIVQSRYPLYHPDFDWTAIVDGFAQQIDSNTKNDVAKLITADFSTTGTIERMASEIVLMETTKSFFEFIIMYVGCGFPSITLTGTVEDWQSIVDKTARLQELGAGKWAKELKPILEQFVQAAKGNPDKAFWQDIVMKNTPDRLRGGACSMEKPTELDGWFLKLMPYDKEGKPTPAKVPHNYDKMPKQMASAPVKYIEVDTLTGQVIAVIPLELTGGIAGYMADENDCVSFQLGWAVNESEADENLKKFKQMAGWLVLRVDKVPEELRSVNHYDRLELRFTDKVEIPDWMDSMDIGHLVINGKVSADQKKELKRRFVDRIEFE
ncbi:MAG: DUF4419 domain-containing protein [Bacteroidaceae bacterium]|nr:DUF4419 domain-containing protein [Bacteroidaceae bacterium]